MGGGGVGRLLTFPAFRLGAYSNKYGKQELLFCNTVKLPD